jgi:Tfp pilus assembly protein PilV
MSRPAVIDRQPARLERFSVPARQEQRHGWQGGFSYIEILLSLGILSVGVLALTELQVTTTNGSNAVSMRTTAVSILEKKVEALKSLPYASVQSEKPTTVVEAGGTFTRQVTVKSNSPLLNTKTVDVSVSWVIGGVTYSALLTTIISQ